MSFLAAICFPCTSRPKTWNTSLARLQFVRGSVTVPAYWSVIQLQLLMITLLSPSIVAECINQVRTIASLYANLHRLLRSCPHVEDLPIVAKGFSYRDFRWAVSTVMSRQNKIVLSHKEKVFSPALIPLWDFCNHCQGQVEERTHRHTHTRTNIRMHTQL